MIQHIFGLLLIILSLTLIPSLFIAWWYVDGQFSLFGLMFLGMASTGLLLWLLTRGITRELLLRDGFIIAALFWIGLSLISSIPFLFSPNLNFAQAVFEAVSGVTTTGGTVIIGLDNLPPSILYYRQQLQWLGGLGIVIFAVAILPMLGIGGMQLYRAETPGPMHDDKLTPRLRHTATYLLLIHITLTLACALAYWLAGMNWLDAIGHSFATISTGGFSTHDASLGYFNSLTIECIAMLFMFLGALNFTVHFVAWTKFDIFCYWQDIQGRVFFFIVATLILITTWILVSKGTYDQIGTALRYASFQVISVITTTGFLTADFSSWPSVLPVLILGSSFIGGCVGSTAGGIRVIRLILLYKQATRGIMRLIHPNALLIVKIQQKRVPNDVIEAVWEFSALYIASYVFLSLLLMTTDVDIITAFSAVAACFNMAGPGLGAVASNFSSIGDIGLWILSFSMLLARLEIFTLLVVLSPAFWRK